MRWDIGIDLGTENVRVAELRHGPVMDIPAAMAFREGKMSPICAGEIAQRLIGRTCEGVSVHYPLKDGVLESTDERIPGSAALIAGQASGSSVTSTTRCSGSAR